MHDYLKGRSNPIMSMFFFMCVCISLKSVTILLQAIYSAKTKIRSKSKYGELALSVHQFL